jgi:hypothetical protein
MRDKLCCANDNDCVTGDECVGGTCSATQPSQGVCKPKPKSGCWSNADCKNILAPSCNGARVCPCGADCLLADALGTCQSILSTN